MKKQSIAPSRNLRPFKRLRWVIDFFDRSEHEARSYPQAFDIIDRLVRPVRAEDNRVARRERFWRFGEIARGLYERLACRPSAIARLFTCEYWFWARIRPIGVYTNALVIVTRDQPWDFAVLSSSFHEIWAVSQGSSLETRFRYTPSRCFGTFPFPLTTDPDTVGNAYHEFRRDIMHSRQQGLTDTYSKFHDRNIHDRDFQDLRRLHVELDYAVAAAYGWQDLHLGHDFHETKRGIRFTVSDESRRMILDRLSNLNHEHHAEELAAQTRGPKKKRSTKSKTHATTLF
jgi:hypothetical protein